jgi:hypothetical protein
VQHPDLYPDLYPDLCPRAAQEVGDGRFSVAPPNSDNSLNGIFAQGVVTQTYTQVSKPTHVRISVTVSQSTGSALKLVSKIYLIYS